MLIFVDASSKFDAERDFCVSFPREKKDATRKKKEEKRKNKENIETTWK